MLDNYTFMIYLSEQTVTREAGANPRVHAPRVVVQVHRPRASIRTVAPVAALAPLALLNALYPSTQYLTDFYQSFKTMII